MPPPPSHKTTSKTEQSSNDYIQPIQQSSPKIFPQQAHQQVYQQQPQT